MKSCDAGYSAVHDPARSIVASLGLAAMLATLLVYSGAVTPFQRYDLLRTFIDSFPSVALESAFLAAVVVLVLSAVGKRIPLRVINWVGGGLFIIGDLAFCAMAILGSPGDWAPVVDGVACGIGSCAVCLAWGRVMRRCDLRSATLCVCVATMLAVLLGLGMYVLPVPVAIAMFVVCVGLAAAVPIVYASDSPCVAVGEERIPAIATANKAGKASRTSVPEVEHDAKADAGGDSPFSRMRSFLDVATAPAIGLALFAFIMGVRGESVVVDYPYVLIAQLVASTLILVCMFALRGSPLTRVVYRGLIPIVSVCVMAVVSVSRLIPNGFGAELFMVHLLCTLAVTLTLATLAGIAHAAEFSPDIVFSVAVMLHCIASRAGQLANHSLPSEVVMVGMTAVTAVYSVGMVVHAVLRSLRGDEELPGDVLVGIASASGTLPGEKAQAQGDREGGIGQPDWAQLLAQRCDELARQHHLTQREREILGYLAQGHSSAYIGESLLISPNTVRTHVHNIYGRLGVATRDEILALTRPKVDGLPFMRNG